MTEALKKTGSSFKVALPIMAGVLMLVNLLNPLLEKYYIKIFTENYLIDSLIGAVAGSISFGIPLTSYIVGGELLNQGVSLIAVTAFMLSWTMVGIVMLPLEIFCLGRKFAIVRNVFNFIFVILLAILIVLTFNFI